MRRKPRKEMALKPCEYNGLRQCAAQKTENITKNIHCDVGSLAETRSLTRSRFFAAELAQTCLNLRVRPKKTGEKAKYKKPSVSPQAFCFQRLTENHATMIPQ